MPGRRNVEARPVSRYFNPFAHVSPRWVSDCHEPGGEAVLRRETKRGWSPSARAALHGQDAGVSTTTERGIVFVPGLMRLRGTTGYNVYANGVKTTNDRPLCSWNHEVNDGAARGSEEPDPHFGCPPTGTNACWGRKSPIFVKSLERLRC